MVAKILVVDDEPDLEILLRQKFRKKIRQNQLELFFASNGIEALQKLADKPDIDMVLTDINMPIMDGLTLLERIKKLNPFLKAVIVSAYGDMENIRKAMNLGAFDFLVKPINFQDLEITTQKTISQIEQIKLILEQELIAKQELAELSNKLQKERQKIAHFLNVLPIGIYAVNSSGQLYYLNQEGQKLLNIKTKSRAIGQQITDIYQLYSSETKKIYPLEARPIWRALKGEKITRDDISIHHDNQILPVEICAVPIYNSDRAIVGAIAILQTIISRKQSEKERIESAQKQAILQQLNFLANYDRITKIANRRRFDEVIQEEWQRLKLQKKPLSIITCEIDYFQQYRDYWGPRRTEDCLREIAEAIETVVQIPGNLVARYQESIFAIILPDTNLEAATAIAEKIRQAVKQLELNSTRSDFNYISLSLGVAGSVPTATSSHTNTIDKAITALEGAKLAGGDRICQPTIL